MHDVCTMIAHCISYLELPNTKIKLFTDKEVTNWINNKLKDKKYHEVLTLTMEEFVKQEQNKKQREQEAEKTQPKKGPETQEGEEGKYVTFLYTACRNCAYSVQMQRLMFVNCFSRPIQAQAIRCRLQAL